MARPEQQWWPVAALLAALLASLLLLAFPQQKLALQDLLNRSLPAPPDARVVVVGIDDVSLRDYGTLTSWNRELYARALTTLRQAGARAVGIDVLFDSPAPGDAALAQSVSWPGTVLASTPQLPQGPRPWNTVYGVASLNLESGAVRSFQTAYRSVDGRLWPSFSAQLARLAGVPRPLNTERQILRFVAPDASRLPVLSFRDVVTGNVRFSDLQNKIVLIGLTASASPDTTFPDARRAVVPGVELQARAVTSLLAEPLRPVALWFSLLICAALAALAVWAGGLWGFGLALLGLGLSAPLYSAGWLFPGVMASLSAIVGTAFVAAERVLTLRRLGTLDPLTGLGNRLAFTRAAEHRWASRAVRPLGLLLIDLGGFRRVNEVYGRAAGDQVLREVAAALRLGRTRRELVFRWGADEFALLVEAHSREPQGELTRLVEHLQSTFSDLRYRDIALRISVGQAVSTPQMTQAAELIEQASRDRYRMKYRLEQR
ncbi:CHASE2 domain-containing protein [Deinococcus alpinitundrae]|uniref:CHASE2 domain-containing protein n=1 Tax=Deinococcus alpinitundrae TaxID=468913 RepID=UPI0013797CAD|nr:CHASE2 domain-containing protein [Deinococcus alpinitundrae]